MKYYARLLFFTYPIAVLLGLILSRHYLSPTRAYAAETIEIPVEISLEYETALEYPQYEQMLQDIITQVNQKAKQASIERRFFIQKFLPHYHQKDWLKNTPPVPDYFFDHPNNLVYIAIDGKTEGTSQAFWWFPSLIIHGNSNYTPYWNVLGENGWYIFSHELMHAVGALDLYVMNIGSPDNAASQMSYKNRYNDCIMSSWGAQDFSSYTVALINQEMFPPQGQSWYTYLQPQSVFKVYDEQKTPVPSVPITLYRSSTKGYDQVLIDATPEWSGTTTSAGEFTITEPLFEQVWDEINQTRSYPAVLLIKTNYQQATFWSWLEITQANELFWQGKKDQVTYGIYTDWNLDQLGRTYEALWIEQTHGPHGVGSPLEIHPGQTISVLARFKNTGTATWHQTGVEKIGFYVYKDPMYSTPLEFNNPLHPFFGQSYFADESWGTSYDGKTKQARAALLKETTVLPGEIGTFEFIFHAPTDAEINVAHDNPSTPQREDFYREDLTLAFGPTWMHNTTNGDPLGFAHIWFPIRVTE